jgi:photosystem II stability/assembly factor-like uncharacterized protein
MMGVFLFRNNIIKCLFIVFLFLHFDNFCFSQWSHIDIPSTDLGVDISFPDSNFGVVSNGTLGCYKTFDRGNSWTHFFPNMSIQNLLFLTRDTAMAYNVLDNQIVKSIDGGLNWIIVDSLANIPANPSISNFFFLPDHQTGYVMFMPFNFSGDSVYCLRTMNGGSSWSIINTFFSPDYPAIKIWLKFAEADTGYFTTSHEIYKTIDGGLTWQLQDTFINEFVVIQPISADTVIAITQYYDVWRSVDGGQTWLACATPVHVPMYDMCYSNDSLYIFGGNGINSGFVLSSSDKGGSWNLALSDQDTYFQANSSPNKIAFATGDNGAVITNNKLFTSISELDRNDFIIFPNPASDQINISTPINKFEYKLRDPLGNIVLTGRDPDFIMTKFLKNGFYTIEFVSTAGRIVKSLIILHSL